MNALVTLLKPFSMTGVKHKVEAHVYDVLVLIGVADYLYGHFGDNIGWNIAQICEQWIFCLTLCNNDFNPMIIRSVLYHYPVLRLRLPVKT